VSVVNKMLQDLDARKQQQIMSSDYVPRQIKPDKIGKYKVWGLAACICLVSLAFLASQLTGTDSSGTSVVSLPPQSFSSDITEELESPLTQLQASVSADVSYLSASAEPAIALIDSGVEGLQETQEVTSVTPTVDVASTIEADDPLTLAEVTAPESETATQVAIQDALQTVVAAQAEQQDEERGEFSMAPSNGAKVELSSLREQARLALADDHQTGAITALRAIVSNYPEDLRAPKQLASLLFSQQRFSEAAKVLEDALQAVPADSSLRMMLSRIAFKTGDIQSAYDTLAAHPFERLADTELLSFRAALAERLQHYEHATEDYSLLVGREPRNARWWLGLGVSQDKLAQNAAAIKSYQQAKDLNQLPSQVREFLQERIEILARQS